MVRLLYFARLREALDIAAEEVELPAQITDVARLITWLGTRGETWQRELGAGRNIRVAVNQEMAEPATGLGAGDEIAIFPPVTGG